MDAQGIQKIRKSMIKENIKKILFYLFIFIFVFALDRFSKLYILNLSTIEQVDIYVFSFLNLYLIWNTGVGFGLFSLNDPFYYNLVTVFIVLINIFLLIMIFKSKKYKIFFLTIILGGSMGNLFDRLYYKAVPDFIDMHYQNYHWFVFNIADVFITIGILCLIFDEIFIKNRKISNDL